MNILGVGLEILDHHVWHEQMLKRDKKFLDRYFTPAEKKYCNHKRNPKIHYGARWACKQAVAGALGLAKRDEILRGIEVAAGLSGAPAVFLKDSVLQKKKRWEILKIKVSLSHSETYSAAEVIVLGKEKNKVHSK